MEHPTKKYDGFKLPVGFSMVNLFLSTKKWYPLVIARWFILWKKTKNELWDDLGAPPILGNLQVSLQTGAGGSRLEHRGVMGLFDSKRDSPVATQELKPERSYFKKTTK